VIGYTLGGNPFDALIVGCYEGSKLKYVAKVRAGFVPHMRCALYPLLHEFRTEKCPFTDLPEKRRTLYSLTRDEMQKCQWLKPLVVAQIEFAQWTPDGHLRHASFAGLRTDKEPASSGARIRRAETFAPALAPFPQPGLPPPDNESCCILRQPLCVKW
jgi:bifunctional non-homologous end joining protein LigD